MVLSIVVWELGRRQGLGIMHLRVLVIYKEDLLSPKFVAFSFISLSTRHLLIFFFFICKLGYQASWSLFLLEPFWLLWLTPRVALGRSVRFAHPTFERLLHLLTILSFSRRRRSMDRCNYLCIWILLQIREPVVLTVSYVLLPGIESGSRVDVCSFMCCF